MFGTKLVVGTVASAALIALSLGCGSGSRGVPGDAGPASSQSGLVETSGGVALAGINSGSLLEHVTVLSSDEFGGRAPGSEGEAKTVDYLTARFSEFGLSAGNPDGSYVQKVPLVGITTTTAEIQVAGKSLSVGTDAVFWTKRVVDNVTSRGELVFVGYGVEAPENDWNDYKDMDVEGKVLVMLVNDPPVEGLFGDEAMTYYGRWTYKYEIAAAKKAAGALIIHETGPAGYPWEVVSGSWTGEQFDLQTEDKNMGRVPIEGWLSSEMATSILREAGLDFAELKSLAASRDFQPVSLGVEASARVENTFRNVDSHNVIALLEGTEAPEELMLYVAHWDHLGTLADIEGDTIFNGAFDNGTGTAGLLGLAEAYAHGERPRRSVGFLAVTAEEQGLLGSRYYAEHPLYPAAKTVAVINMDGLNVWGRTRDFTVVGLGQSSLDTLAADVAATQKRTLRPDPEPEKGFYYRSDHFEFAKVGIPAFYGDSGVDFIDRPEGWGLERREEYTVNDYHKPSDEVKDWYELSGMIEDLHLFYEMGRRLVNSSDWPQWSDTSEFRAKREEHR